MRGKWTIRVLVTLVLATACSEDDPEAITPPGVIPPISDISCKVDEIEFRDEEDAIIGVREFNYDVNKNNRLESVSIVEEVRGDPLNLRFQFHYPDESSKVPRSVDEVFGGEIATSINFQYDAKGDLIEFTQHQVAFPSVPPETHVFFYEPSELANDSINTRIIIFDIENLTRDWIDVSPALFTNGGQRITRFERITFNGHLLEFCDFTYNEQGSLEEIVCKTADFVLSEVWNFTYEDQRLLTAYRQLPNFRAFNSYEYDSEGKPNAVVSTTNGFFNWKGSYFYLCR